MKTNFIVTSLLAVVLLSGVFFSLVGAQATDIPPDPSAAPDSSSIDSNDNSTISQNDNAVLYTIQDNSTASQREPVPQIPGAEDTNLIATQTHSDNTLPIVAGAIILVVVACALGFFGWRKKFAKA